MNNTKALGLVIAIALGSLAAAPAFADGGHGREGGCRGGMMGSMMDGMGGKGGMMARAAAK